MGTRPTSVVVTGMDELLAALRELPARLEKNVIKGGLRAAAKILVVEAQRRCPVSDKKYAQQLSKKGRASYIANVKPGFLRKNIRAKDVPGKAGTVKIIVGWRAKAYYGVFVEYGTSKITAQPFLRPAFDTKKQEMIDDFKRYVAERLAREVATLKR